MCRSCSFWIPKLQCLLPQICEPLKGIKIGAKWFSQCSHFSWLLVDMHFILCSHVLPSPATLKWNKSGCCSALHQAHHHSFLSSCLSQVFITQLCLLAAMEQKVMLRWCVLWSERGKRGWKWCWLLWSCMSSWLGELPFSLSSHVWCICLPCRKWCLSDVIQFSGGGFFGICTSNRIS